MDHLDTSGQWRKVDGQPLAGNPIDTDTEGYVSRREEIGPEYTGIPPLLYGRLLPFGDRRRGICPSARQLAEIGELGRVTQRIGGLVAPGALNPHTVGVVLDDGFVVGIYEPLDKLGVNYQLIRHGKYKSAGEMYVNNAPSQENMEQNQVMVNSMWETISNETAEARGISVDSLNYFVENLSIGFPEDMINHNLADELLSVEGYKEKMATLAGKEAFKDVKFVSLKEYATAKVKANTSAKKKIAIIYADGNIVEQDDPNNISGDRFARIISKVRADSTVKAVVFRVNSPGGTVLSASKIKEEIDLTKKVKPVVASYGAYAASGGYWISNNCDHIISGATRQGQNDYRLCLS